MKALLTSDGLTNTTIISAFSHIVGYDFSMVQCVYIPTAANGEPADPEGFARDTGRFRRLGFASFELLDISLGNPDEWIDTLFSAGVIVVGGGSTEFLLNQFERTGLLQKIPELCGTRVYVGISAGSMIASESVSLLDEDYLYYGNRDSVRGIRKGLGMVKFEILPHYNSPSFPNMRESVLSDIRKNKPQKTYILDDQSAIIIDDDFVQIVTEGGWKII